jgi:hypothetical protein
LSYSSPAVKKRKPKKKSGYQAYSRAQDTSFKGVLSTKNVCSVYDFVGTVGEGQYGIVKLVKKNNYDKMNFAMKTIPLEEGAEIYV